MKNGHAEQALNIHKRLSLSDFEPTTSPREKHYLFHWIKC